MRVSSGVAAAHPVGCVRIEVIAALIWPSGLLPSSSALQYRHGCAGGWSGCVQSYPCGVLSSSPLPAGGK